MQIINTVIALRERLALEANIAFVPTMGNLHAGHINLIKFAKQQDAINQKVCVVVSIFVNPLQFGANEDLSAYPRTLQADCAKLKEAGVNIVFIPEISELYPDFDTETSNLGQSMMIVPPPIADELCGTTRPGNFSGVATVVLKLFNIVKPTTAIFGKKDFQQLFIIRELVRQFNLSISIIAADTVRKPDGLAMSSRNSYLTITQRKEASELQKTLARVVTDLQTSRISFIEAEQAAIKHLSTRGWAVDYISIRIASTLLAAKRDDKAAIENLVILGAARLGKTRLIDNIEFKLASS